MPDNGVLLPAWNITMAEDRLGVLSIHHHSLLTESKQILQCAEIFILNSVTLEN
jgi:hypothetical protein